jgi:hypothetical protein
MKPFYKEIHLMYEEVASSSTHLLTQSHLQHLNYGGDTVNHTKSNAVKGAETKEGRTGKKRLKNVELINSSRLEF